MSRYYVRPPDQVAYGLDYCGPGNNGVIRIDTQSPWPVSFHANFSGYAIPPGDERTVVEVAAYYAANDPEKGQPISGDETARFHHWRATGEWPTVNDVWAAIGLGADGLPVKPPAPVQTSIFDLLEAS
ncbi:MAG: hypothetical protein ACTMIK_11250 [Galactobacter sp.]